jgi:hypothetical protein
MLNNTEDEAGRMTLLKTLLLLRRPVAEWALDARVYGLLKTMESRAFSVLL